MENNNVDGDPEKAKVENGAEETNNTRLSRIKIVISRVKNGFIKVYNVCKSLGGLVFLLVIYNIIGGVVFQTIEAPKELEVKAEMSKTRNEYLLKFYSEAKNLWVKDDVKYNMTWFNNTIKLLREYETEVRARGTVAGPETVWTFWSAMFFCGTIYTSIGYGNIVPLTGIGRFLAMVYAVLGIPLALLVLAEVGRRFTVLLKIIYGAVRRYYYTGSFRKKVKNVRNRISRRYRHSVQHIEKATTENGLNPTIRQRSKSEESIIFVKHKKNSSSSPNDSLKSKAGSEASLNLTANAQNTLSSTDGVKVMYDIEIDDSFNLPLSVAGVILIIYIFLGGIMYLFWEDWTFLESIYFVFISLSTIGFGDIAPAHPKYFIITSIYMFMGLALVSMCVNVGIEFFTQTIDKAKAQIDKAKERVVVAGKEKMAVVGKEMNKAKDKVSKAGTSAKDKISEVKKNIELNIQNELKRAKKHSIDSSENRSKENTP